MGIHYHIAWLGLRTWKATGVIATHTWTHTGIIGDADTKPCAHAYMHIYTNSCKTLLSAEESWEGSSFRHKLFMLMLLNYLCYLCYCDVWLSLKEVYFGLSWQPVKAQEVRLYLCVWECISLCICMCVMARVPKTPDTLGVLCWHWGWVSGNHPGDITLATGLSLRETVEAHPCRCRMTGRPLRTGNASEIKCVYLCISVAIAKISLCNAHRHTFNYKLTVYTYNNSVKLFLKTYRYYHFFRVDTFLSCKCIDR